MSDCLTYCLTLFNLFLQLARSFRFWQQLHGHCEVSRAHSQQRDQNQLREYFQEWRDYTLEIRADKYYVVAIQQKVWGEKKIAANRRSSSNSLEQNHITLYAKGLLGVLLDRRRLGQKSGRKWRETETGQWVLLKKKTPQDSVASLFDNKKVVIKVNSLNFGSKELWYKTA